MKKKILLSVIPAICVIIIAGLVIVNINTKENKGNLSDSSQAEGNNSYSIPEYVPELDENGVDCAVIREGELFDYLIETALNNGRLRKSTRVETEDGRCYVYKELGHNDCAWIREFTDEEAEEFIEAGFWDKLILNFGAEGFDYNKRTVLSAKLQPYLNSADLRSVIYELGSGIISTYEGSALVFKDKVIVYYSYSVSPNYGGYEYGYAVLDYDECKDWILPRNISLFNKPAYEEDESDYNLAITFFNNLADIFKAPDEQSIIRGFAQMLENYLETRDTRHYGADCTPITEGELFDDLCNQYNNDEKVRETGIATGLDGWIYAVVAYDSSDGNAVPVSWVETFSDKDAAEFCKTDAYLKSVCDETDESYDEEYATIMKAKLRRYLNGYFW